ncbi:MAG: extracellular solute-binding protein, partial [Oscillospiraceae bacterium]|nr:extracellular solute-binding protein [Oscillospiraceae bacterium]
MKKIIAMLLALVMLLGCLAACNQTPPDQTKDTTPPKENTEYVAPTQNTDPKEELGKLPLTEEDVTITIGLPQSANTEDYETNDYTLWLEEKTGINLEFKLYSGDKSEAITQLNLEVAGDEKLPDIIWGFSAIDNSLMYELGEDGYLVDLKDYYSKYGYWFWEEMASVPENDQKALFQYGTDPSNGAFYAFPRYVSQGSDAPNTRPGINVTWLEAVGAEMPTTVDELYEVLKKFAAEDPNGNGKADEIPLLGSSKCYRTDTVQWIINAYVFCMDEYFFNATDGEIWVPYTTEEYRQALVYLNKL